MLSLAKKYRNKKTKCTSSLNLPSVPNDHTLTGFKCPIKGTVKNGDSKLPYAMISVWRLHLVKNLTNAEHEDLRFS